MSGIRYWSLSAIRVKPSIDEPSNHVPCLTEPSSWWIGIVTALTRPMMSVNWSWTKRIPVARASATASATASGRSRSSARSLTAGPFRLLIVRLRRGGASLQDVQREREPEAERRDDARHLAGVLVGLGHHRVGEHREDRAARERRTNASGSGGASSKKAEPTSDADRRDQRRRRATGAASGRPSSRSRRAPSSRRSPRAGSR